MIVRPSLIGLARTLFGCVITKRASAWFVVGAALCRDSGKPSRHKAAPPFRNRSDSLQPAPLKNRQPFHFGFSVDPKPRSFSACARFFLRINISKIVSAFSADFFERVQPEIFRQREDWGFFPGETARSKRRRHFSVTQAVTVSFQNGHSSHHRLTQLPANLWPLREVLPPQTRPPPLQPSALPVAKNTNTNP